MRRTATLLLCILLLLAASTICAWGQVQNAGCTLRLIEPVQSDNLAHETDQFSVSFEFNSFNFFVGLTVRNKSEEPIAIDWDKFTMILEGESEPIIFDDTVMALKGQAKGCTIVAPGTYVSRNIGATEYIELELPLYRKKDVKKYGAQQIGFLVPIVSNGQTALHRYTIEVSL